MAVNFLTFSKTVSATASTTTTSNFTTPQGRPPIYKIGMEVGTSTVADAGALTITLNVNGVDIIDSANGAEYALINRADDAVTHFVIPTFIPPGATCKLTVVSNAGSNVNVITRFFFNVN
jgi:hypothetical protein